MNSIISLFTNGMSFGNSDESSAIEFSSYISQFGKSYGTEEEFAFRLNLYLLRDEQIKEWNSRPSETHTLSHNKFSDWTESEMKRIRGFKNQSNQSS